MSARAFFDAFVAGERDGLIAAMAPDAAFYGPLGPEPYEGPETLADVMLGFSGAVASVKGLTFMECGEHQVGRYEADLDGTRTAEILHIFTCDGNGRVDEIVAFMRPILVMEAWRKSLEYQAHRAEIDREDPT